jgi:hypothetical protein
MEKYIISNKLILASRPGYPMDEVSSGNIKLQIDRWKKIGIKSIIVLLTSAEMKKNYPQLKTTLSGLYNLHGFKSEWIPIFDTRNATIPFERSVKVLAAYQRLPKPCLIHCSAGQHRSVAASRTIQSYEVFPNE